MFLGFLLNRFADLSRESEPFERPPSSSEYFQAKATVVSPIRGFQEGRIKLHGIFWFARLANPTDFSFVESGSLVTITGRERNTLVVRPYSHASSGVTLLPILSDSMPTETYESIWLN